MIDISCCLSDYVSVLDSRVKPRGDDRFFG